MDESRDCKLTGGDGQCPSGLTLDTGVGISGSSSMGKVLAPFRTGVDAGDDECGLPVSGSDRLRLHLTIKG